MLRDNCKLGQRRRAGIDPIYHFADVGSATSYIRGSGRLAVRTELKCRLRFCYGRS